MKYCPELEKEFFGKPKSDVNITVFSILFFVGVLFFLFFLGLLYIYRYQITSLDGKGRNKCKLDLLINFFQINIIRLNIQALKIKLIMMMMMKVFNNDIINRKIVLYYYKFSYNL